MLLAWMLTGSVGTFVASFYKPDWPSKTLFGQKVWFQVSNPPSTAPPAPLTLLRSFAFQDTLMVETGFLVVLSSKQEQD